VIEDIDCLTDVVMDRRTAKTDVGAAEKTNANDGDAVTLSFLLNLLDGVLETPGRILVITSNYPEKLDHAFVRPGRIDVRIEFRKATREFILDMLNKFYTVSLKLEDVPAELDGKFTPAEVMECMCRSFKSWSGAVANLVAKVEEARAAQDGTMLEDLGISTVVEPATAVAAPETKGATAVSEVVGPQLIISDLPTPSATADKQPDSLNEIVKAMKPTKENPWHPGMPSVVEFEKAMKSRAETDNSSHRVDFSDIEAFCRSPTSYERNIKAPLKDAIFKKSVMFDDTSEFLGATADFGNDEAPVGAGGWFPGMPREEGDTQKMRTSNGPIKTVIVPSFEVPAFDVSPFNC